MLVYAYMYLAARITPPRQLYVEGDIYSKQYQVCYVIQVDNLFRLICDTRTATYRDTTVYSRKCI